MTVRVPVRAGDGSVRAYALVDDADAEGVLTHRWHVNDQGYVLRHERIERRRYRKVRLHRQIMGLEHGDPREVDHENGDPLDNRRSNLRVCTHALNLQNRQKGNRGSTSEHRGVSWHKNRGVWQAQARVNGVVHWLGAFDDELEAARVVAEFRAAHMPFSREAAA